MIDAVCWENAHLFGDALASQHRLRHRIFVERQHWDVPSYHALEYDQFDTPAAVYLIRRDDSGEARAITRLIPTTQPYMIQQLWPELLNDDTPPSASHVWEATRFGVDHGVAPELRRRILGELICGCLEYGLEHGIDHYLSVMPPQIYRRVLIQAGCAVDLAGEPQRLGSHLVAAGRVRITVQSLKRARAYFGLKTGVLHIADELPAAA